MPIEFSCSQCQRLLRVPDDSAGREARCPQCGTVSTVPSPAPGPAPDPSEFAQPFATPNAQSQPAQDNPYAAPFADTTPYASGYSSSYTDFRNPSMWATHGDRLGGAILDGLISLAAALPGLFIIIASGRNEVMMIGGFVVVFLGVLAIEIYQWVLISTSGQSIGKKVVGTRIVDFDNGSNPGFVKAVILRIWVVGLIGAVPYIGGCFGLINILWIFGSERRCLHDLIANTRVVRA